jgi:pantoate--beta-alanine ligase
VHVPVIEDILCGAFRPGHFMGVATVVTKLLNIVQPDVAVFGEKDYQQLLIIRRADARSVHAGGDRRRATTREPDGLAMSSRNRYLSARNARVAPAIYAELERRASRDRVGLRRFRGDRAPGREASATGRIPSGLFRDSATRPRWRSRARSRASWSVDSPARIGRARLIDNVRARRESG